MQQNPWKLLPILLLAIVCTTVSATPAQMESPIGKTAQAAESHMMQGELVKVDAAAQTFTIKQDNGEQTQCQYDSNTKVEGGENGVQGLSNESGSHLTVYYTERSGKKLATKIEIKQQTGK